MKRNSNVEEIYPLSPMQQGMLFHALLHPEAGVYFEQISFSLHGELDVAAFQQAWQNVVDRHPVLRTAFVWKRRKEPFQVVFNRVQPGWRYADWQDCGASENRARLEAFLHEDRASGFDLARPPRLRL